MSHTIKTAYSLLCCKHIATTEELNKSHLAPINLSWAHSQALGDTCSILHGSYQRHGLPQIHHQLYRENIILFTLDQTTRRPQ